MKKYKIIALIGQSGCGKDTLLKMILENNNDIHSIISYTTRPRRDNEIEGINYYFITPEQFAQKAINNELVEMATFNDWFYGTDYECLRSDIINIGVFDPSRVEFLLSDPQIDVTIFYIKASDKQRLLRQLNREDEPNVDEIVRRYGTDKKDFSDLPFEYIELQNNNTLDLMKNVKTILSILGQK